MKPTEYIAKSDSTPKTGLFALLCCFARVRGSGAPKISRVLSVGVLLVAAMALMAAPALAKVSGEHVFSKSFGGACVANPPLEPCTGKFNEPGGVAVNEGTGPQAGDVYVLDGGNKRVEVFSPKENYKYEFEFNGSGSGLNEGKAAGSGGLSNEEETGRFQDPIGIAIDNDPSSPSYEDVYVLDKTGEVHAYGGVVDKFSSSGAYLGQITEEEHHVRFNPHQTYKGAEVYGVAVGDNGEVHIYGEDPYFYGVLCGCTEPFQAFVYNYTDEEQNQFVAQYKTPITNYFGKGFDSSLAFAVDSEGNFYAVRNPGEDTVYKFGNEGGILEEHFGHEIGGGTEVNVSGLAVEQSSDDVYVDDGFAIDRFSEEGSQVESFGSGDLQAGSGVAVSLQSGDVYVADATADVLDVFSVNTAPKEPRIEESVADVERGAATLQGQIDPFRAETKYHFEYDTTPYEGSAPHGTSTPEGSLGSGEAAVPVSVRLEGLASGTTYHYRAVAVNEVATVYGPDKTFTTTASPSSAPETCSNAQPRAEQPYGLGLPDCRAYELVSPLEKNGEGVEEESGSNRASASGDAVAYVSRGAFSGVQGAPEESRYISRRGPDGWSTENVTPPYIAFQTGFVAYDELLFTPELTQGIVENKDVPLLEGEPAGYFKLYLANLASSPASYQSVTTVIPPDRGAYPVNSVDFPEPAGVSADFTHVVFQQFANLTPGAYGGGDSTEGEREEHRHVYEWVGGRLYQVDISPRGEQFEATAKESQVDSVGAPGEILIDEGDAWHAVSDDGSRVFFTVGEGLGGGKTTGQLYVRENPEQPESPVNSERECTVPADACTVEVSASQKTNGTGREGTDPNAGKGLAEGAAWYRDASADGSRVFFTSRVELTNEANTGPDDNAANLYEYNLETKQLTDLTVSNEAKGAAVFGLVTASENVGEENSYVYFVANGVLADNQNSNGETATPGNCEHERGETGTVNGERLCNLYVSHYQNGTWETRFIARLAGGVGNTSVTNDEGDWESEESTAADFGPARHSVRVTPDGTALAFQSERPLTGYDNEQAELGECESTKGGEPETTGKCREVYLYDATTGKLVCASCDPSGARPVGSAELGDEVGSRVGGESDWLAASSFYLARNLSEDGGRLFFNSSDALVPQDTNGKEDVYEWERLASASELAKGESSCTISSATYRTSSGGCVFPISDVAGDFLSTFMDASLNGDNVFVATYDQLVPEADGDTRPNVYDVRVGGGFPVTVAPPVCDNADSCKSPVSPQPGVFAPPSSATFAGPGNPPPPSPPTVVKPKPTTKTVKCKKGLVKNKTGKCVKKPKKKAKAKKSAHTDRRAK